MELFDSIKSQPLCTQPTTRDLIPLTEKKRQDFFTQASSRHFKLVENYGQQPKKSKVDIHEIKYKFQIKANVSETLRELVKESQKPHLLPLKTQYRPNPSQDGLQIGRRGSQSPPLTEYFHHKRLKSTAREPQLTSTTNLRQQTHKDDEAPLNRPTTQRSNQKLYTGSNRLFWQPVLKFEVECEKRDLKYRTLSQKQFNLYKNRNIATCNLAEVFKKRKEKEKIQYREWLKEEERKLEQSFFQQFD